jgi:hypothetical protein
MYLRGCEDGGRIAAVETRVWHDRAASVGGGGAFERREGGRGGLPSHRLRKVETAAGSTARMPPVFFTLFFTALPFSSAATFLAKCPGVRYFRNTARFMYVTEIFSEPPRFMDNDT